MGLSAGLTHSRGLSHSGSASAMTLSVADEHHDCSSSLLPTAQVISFFFLPVGQVQFFLQGQVGSGSNVLPNFWWPPLAASVVNWVPAEFRALTQSRALRFLHLEEGPW